MHPVAKNKDFQFENKYTLVLNQLVAVVYRLQNNSTYIYIRSINDVQSRRNYSMKKQRKKSKEMERKFRNYYEGLVHE